MLERLTTFKEKFIGFLYFYKTTLAVFKRDFDRNREQNPALQHLSLFKNNLLST